MMLTKFQQKIMQRLPDIQQNEVIWLCPHCEREVKPIELDGKYYKRPYCTCNESSLARNSVKPSPSQLENKLVESGLTREIIKTRKLGLFKLTARNLWNGKEALDTMANFCATPYQDGKNLAFIVGNYGTGKSHLAIGSYMRIVAQNNLSCFYVNMIKMNDDIKKNREAFGYYVDKMRLSNALVIDDIDKKSVTKEPLEILYDVFEYRKNNASKKITIVTSNHDLMQLCNLWSSDDKLADDAVSIIRRMQEMMRFVLVLNGGTYGA